MYYGKKSKDRKSKKKQAVLIEQYADLRRRLKQEKNYAALAKLPKDANPNRLKLRDQLNGRPHSGISRPSSIGG